LEQKYFELRKPLQEQRANVVSGAVDVEIEAEESEDATAGVPFNHSSQTNSEKATF
jgi:hypothetical protein